MTAKERKERVTHGSGNVVHGAQRPSPMLYLPLGYVVAENTGTTDDCDGVKIVAAVKCERWPRCARSLSQELRRQKWPQRAGARLPLIPRWACFHEHAQGVVVVLFEPARKGIRKVPLE